MNAQKKGNKKKYLIIAAAALIVILIGAKMCKKDTATLVDVQSPVRKTIVETIPANGKIQPVTEVKISPDVSGEIIELNIKEGDIVKKGDLILKIKQDIYQSALEQSQAGLNAVRAAYKQQEAQTLKTKQNYERNKQLYELKTISKSEWEAAEADWAVAQQQLQAAKFNISSAEAQVKEARENLSKTTVYAPMDGVVSKLSVEIGERVVGTTQMAGTEMFRVANFDAMEVLVNVNENDIIRLSVGDSAEISVDAYTNRKFKGYVTEVANSSTSTTTAEATTFEVKIRIDKDSYSDLLEKTSIPFRPGMSASVQIQTAVAQNVITVPLSAVTTRKDVLPQGASQGVFTYDKSSQSVTCVGIVTGIQDISDIHVLEGVSDTTMVVVSPFNAISKSLSNGSKVKLMSSPKKK